MQTGGDIMGDYSSSIKKLNDELLAFINRYEILDDKDPITNQVLKRFKKQINSHNTTSNQFVDILSKHQKNFDESYKSIYAHHDIEINKINALLDYSLEVINDKYVKKINHLKEEISKIKKDRERKIYELNQDIEFFFISSDQRASIFESEYEENVRRFDYQIQNAKETYNQSIDDHNIMLETNLEALKLEHEEALKSFDESTAGIIDRLNLQMEKTKLELDEVTNKLMHVRTQSKEKMRQESVMLNEQIHEILTDKNKSVVNARERYTKALNDSSNEKEKKRQDYQTSSQKILKDFVFNMTSLDEYLNNYKTNYNKAIDDEKRKLQYKLLELYKKEENDIKNILANGLSINDDYDKYTKKLIKNRNKEYHKLANQYKGQQDKQLINYEMLYEKELEQSRCNKTIMDIERSHSLKIINEKEQSDNKYYQELSNVYENDMNYIIKVSNMKYNQKANMLKCQSRIRLKGYEKDLDISEANFQKKIEMIRSSLEKLELEKKGALDLNVLVHKHENDQYNSKINNLSVNTLLEIEKCKLLDQYNLRQYQQNILNTKTNLLYSKKKLEIENQQFETLTKITMKKIKNELQRDLISTAYKIREEQILEDLDKKIQNRNSQYAIDSKNHNALYERFKGEIRTIHQILSTFVLLIKDAEAFITRLLSTFLNSVSVRPEYMNIIRIFINDFLNIVLDYFKNLVIDLNENESRVINRRLDFEEKFKFKVYYNDLVQNYENDRKKLLAKRKSINDTLDNYVKTVDSFKNRIYNIENQNNLIKGKILTHTGDKNQKNTLIAELNNNKLRINDFQKKIDDINGFKEILEKDNKQIINDLKDIDNEYNKRVNEIKKMQYNSAISYYTLRNDITKATSIIIDRAESLIEEIQDNPINYYNLNGTINYYRNKLNKFNTSICKNLYNIINIFNEKTSKAIKKEKSLLIFKFKNDIDHIHNKARIQLDNNQYEFDKKISAQMLEYRHLEAEYNEKEKYFNQMLKDNDTQYNIDVNEILDNKKKSLTRFYNEFNAMCENTSGINTTFNHEMHDLKQIFQQNKVALSKNVVNESNIISNNLEEFIKAKDEIINHLPQATKFQFQQLNKETREINSQIEADLRNEKMLFNTERRNIQKNITRIQEALNQTLVENEIEYQRDIIKEKKNHAIQIKHIENNYKFS